MNRFSKSSRNHLETCCLEIKEVFNIVLGIHDCTIMEGHRVEARQNMLFNSTPQRSKVPFPNSKHNSYPSRAIDVAPYIAGRGIPWPDIKSNTYIKDMQQWSYFAGIVLTVAETLGYTFRWGGDWDRDHNLSDQSFNDLAHFELIKINR